MDRGVRRAWVSWDIILMTLDLAYHYVGLHERRQTVLCLRLENKSSQVLRTPCLMNSVSLLSPLQKVSRHS